jgi:Xaa-Pro aminopeptidase
MPTGRLPARAAPTRNQRPGEDDVLIERSNLERLMASAGLGAIIATDAATVAALIGYRSWLDGQFRQFMVRPWESGDLIRTYAVFTPGDRPVAAVVDALFARDAASAGAECWMHGSSSQAALIDMGAGFDRTAEEAIASVLNARGVADAKIGLEADGLRSRELDRLAAQCPKAALRDCTTLLRLARSIKSAAHIAHIRNVTGIAADALHAVLGVVGPGVRLGELADAYAEAAGSRGAAIEHFALSHRGRGIATDRSMTLTADAVTYLDHGCRIALAVSDAGTTLRLRDLTRDERFAHSALEASLSAGRELLASHANSSAVHRAMSESIEPFPDAIVQGHGLGVEIREYPLLVPSAGERLRDECIDMPADLQLQAGMVVNLEASLFGLGDASLHMEETYLVTENGAEALARSEADIGGIADGRRSIERAWE